MPVYALKMLEYNTYELRTGDVEGPRPEEPDAEPVERTESERVPPRLDLGEPEAPPSLGAGNTWDDPWEENWSTQLVDEVDISVGMASTEEITETDPFSERTSGSWSGTLSTLDVRLDSDGAVGCCSSMRAFGTFE